MRRKPTRINPETTRLYIAGIIWKKLEETGDDVHVRAIINASREIMKFLDDNGYHTHRARARTQSDTPSNS